jgi:hypothetical protein
VRRGSYVGSIRNHEGVLSDRYACGSFDLSPLVRRWQLLDALYAAARTALANRPKDLLHARMIDEQQSAGHRVYMVAERCLGVAWDNHAALVALLQSSHGLSPSAPWNLLRPTFEAAFYAAWVLDPEDTLERRRRALRLEWLDELDHRKYYKDAMVLLGEDPTELAAASEQLAAAQARNETSYAADAKRLGLSWPLPKSVVVTDELGGLSHCQYLKHSDVLLRSVWRSLSGHQHGRASAMLRGSDRLDQREVPGGMHTVLSINDEAFTNAADVTTNMHMEAVALLLRRSRPVPTRP